MEGDEFEEVDRLKESGNESDNEVAKKVVRAVGKMASGFSITRRWVKMS